MSAKPIIKGSLYRIGTREWHIDVAAGSSWEAWIIGMDLIGANK